MRHDDGLVYRGQEHRWRTHSGEGGGALLEKEALAVNGLDDALGLQLGVGLGDGVADIAVPRPGGGGRAGVAGAQPAGSGGIADLVGQLEIDRLAGLKIDSERSWS